MPANNMNTSNSSPLIKIPIKTIQEFFEATIAGLVYLSEEALRLFPLSQMKLKGKVSSDFVRLLIKQARDIDREWCNSVSPMTSLDQSASFPCNM
jgi:hypothetical protein